MTLGSFPDFDSYPISDANTPPSLREETPQARSPKSIEEWCDRIKHEVTSILGLPEDYTLDLDLGFFDLGMTSLMVIELQDRLQSSLVEQLELPQSLVFDYPSILSLAEYLADALDVGDAQPANNGEVTERGPSVQSVASGPEASSSSVANSDLPPVKSVVVDSEDIAVIGMGCRFPGQASSPEAFWQLLRNGVDATMEIPPDRQALLNVYSPELGQPGTLYAKRGGFLDAIAQFDAEFFGIAPRETAKLDPQQRLLLEVAWEALEHAGQSPDRLQQHLTGVYVGLINGDYAKLQIQTGNAEQFNAHYGTGTALSGAAGRLSYFLGLQGPALVVDTACSSSLVTIHLACQSLRSRETAMAIAGGCNLMLAPDSSIYLSQAKAISPDGRCKTFDARADGYSRGEGCGLVILKRLSDAIAAGDKIWAVIKGSAVNHDGRTSGFTVPNGLSQEALLQSALRQAKVKPETVSYIEAHGTGTPLGDPIEVGAIANVFTPDRPAHQPLRIGSVKTNIGHLESAAGIAGLIKVVLALHHREIPPHLHLQTLNPRISLQDGRLDIPTCLTPWDTTADTRIAGVSSFGLSGTNAHVVLAEAPPSAVSSRPDSSDTNSGMMSVEAGLCGEARSHHLVTLSAKTPTALKALAQKYLDFIASTADLKLADLAFTTKVGRAHFSERMAIVAASVEEVEAQLRTFTTAPASINLPQVASVQRRGAPKALIICPDPRQVPLAQGYAAYQSHSQLRELLRPWEQCWYEHDGEPHSAVGSLAQDLNVAATRPHDVTMAQHIQMSCALMYGVAKLWQSFGIQPTCVIGFGWGELVAACVMGLISLEELIRFLKQLDIAPGESTEAVTSAPEEDTARDVTTGNSPHAYPRNSVPSSAISEGGIFVVSGTTMQPVTSEELSSPVYQARLTQNMSPASPSTNLQGIGEWLTDYSWCISLGSVDQRAESLCSVAASLRWLYSFAPQSQFWKQSAETCQYLYLQGYSLNWEAIEAGHPHQPIVLPTYPFQRQRYWFEEGGRSMTTLQESYISSVRSRHRQDAGQTWTLLGNRVDSPLQHLHQFETQLSLDAFPILRDHRVYDQVIVPATVYLVMAITAATEIVGHDVELSQISFRKALQLPETGSCTVQTILEAPLSHIQSLDAEPSSRLSVRIFSQSGSTQGHRQSNAATPTPGASAWTIHVQGQIQQSARVMVAARSIEAIQMRCSEYTTGSAVLYDAAKQRGLDLGESFRWIEGIWRCPGEALGQLRSMYPDPTPSGCYFHPGLLDACCQLLNATLENVIWDNTAYVPVEIKRLQVLTPDQLNQGYWVHAQLHTRPNQTKQILGTITLLDQQGRALLLIDGLQVKRVTRSALLPSGYQTAELAVADAIDLPSHLYHWQWHPLPHSLTTDTATARSPQASAGQWVIFMDEAGLGEAVCETLQAQGQSFLQVRSGSNYHPLASAQTHGWVQLRADHPDDYRQFFQDLNATGNAIAGIAHLWSLDVPEPDGKGEMDDRVAAMALCWQSALFLVQASIQSFPDAVPPLQFVTAGAQALNHRSVDHPSQATLWGLLGALAYEHSGLTWRIIDVPPLDSDRHPHQYAPIARQLVQDWSDAHIHNHGETYIAYDQGQRFCPRLQRFNATGLEVTYPRMSSDATYLITGGLGALGLHLATWLVDQGVRSLVLVSRRSRESVNSDTEAHLTALEAQGAKVVVVAADVADAQSMAAVIAQCQAIAPLKGVFHAAGVLDDGVILQQTPDRFHTVMAPKVIGAWNLHQLTAPLDLDYFVLFSSAASLVGSAGQSNYAAANAYLDAIAHYRQARGLPALSVNWGAWAEGGMATSLQQQWKTKGIYLIQPNEGLDTLAQLMGHPHLAQVGVFPVDWPRFLAQLPCSRPPRLLADWDTETNAAVTEQQTHASNQSQTRGSIRQRLEQVPLYDRKSRLEEYLSQVIRESLGLPETYKIKANQGLFEMGMDSLMAVDLQTRLQSDLGQSLPATLVFDHPSLEALTQYITDEVLHGSASSDAKSGPTPERTSGSMTVPAVETSEGVAIAIVDSNGGAVKGGTSTPGKNGVDDSELDHLDDLSEADLHDLLAQEMAAVHELMQGDEL